MKAITALTTLIVLSGVTTVAQAQTTTQPPAPTPQGAEQLRGLEARSTEVTSDSATRLIPYNRPYLEGAGRTADLLTLTEDTDLTLQAQKGDARTNLFPQDSSFGERLQLQVEVQQ